MKRWIMLRLWILLEQYFEKGNYRFDYRDRIDLQKRHKKYNEQKRISKLYHQRPDVIEKKKKYFKEYNARPDVKQVRHDWYINKLIKEVQCQDIE